MLSHGNVVEYLERSAAKNPRKCAVVDESQSWTYGELLERSRRIGTALVKAGAAGNGVVIIMEKSAQTLSVMMGALYAGAFYIPVDPNVPPSRLKRILDTLEDPCIVSDKDMDLGNVMVERKPILNAAMLVATEVDDRLLAQTRKRHSETDPVYTLFTSGSTGNPKGVAISHHAVETFIDSFTRTFGFSEHDRFANQAPFDFDVSTKDIYSSLSLGATLIIVPRRLFMQPTKLVGFLERNEATVLIWAVAALCIVSAYHAFGCADLGGIRKVLFSGETIPAKHLRAWRESLPHATYVNLYGPTEVTCNCLYHVLDPDRPYNDGIPLGASFSHCHVSLVSEDGSRVTEPDVEGEIVVTGPSLALGYVGMPEVTARAFTQNPLNPQFPERAYRTGDMAALSPRGELFFHGRKDNQVKFLGHRVELEEIDLAFERQPEVMRCRCLFDSEKKRIRAFYEGVATRDELIAFAKDQLPDYMRPSSIQPVTAMPLSKNGKIDRNALLDIVGQPVVKEAI